jgi:hypothetical protein
LALEVAVVALHVTKVWVLEQVLVVFFLAHLLFNKIILTQYLLAAVAQAPLAQMELEQMEDQQQLLV